MENRLSEDDRLLLEAHLLDCDACLENLVLGKTLARNMEQSELESVPYYVTQSAMLLVNELNTSLIKKTGKTVKKICSAISDYLTPEFGNVQPIAAAIRGTSGSLSEHSQEVIKRFKGIKIKIQIDPFYSEQRDHQHGTIKVSLMVPSHTLQSNIRVSLKKEERELASYLLNPGEVLFEEVPWGTYHLVFTKDGTNIGEYAFTTHKA
jgi:hypothetical protein